MTIAVNATSYFDKAYSASTIDVSVAAVAGEALVVMTYYGSEWSGPGTVVGTPVWDPSGDNQAFTAIGSPINMVFNGFNTPTQLWRLNSVTSSKTAPVRFTVSETHSWVGALVRRVSGHDTGDLVRASNTRVEGQMGANDLPNTVDSAVGDAVLFFGIARDVNDNFNAGDTSDYADFVATPVGSAMSGVKAGASPTVTGTFAYIPENNYTNALLAVSLKAASSDTTAPTITGPGSATGSTSSISVAENQTTVHTFTADESVTWDLNGGADVAKFQINSSTGALTFTSAPDYETPTDADTNNTYVVGVRATDAATNATTQTVTVTVTNVDDTAPTLSSLIITPGTTTAGLSWTAT